MARTPNKPVSQKSKSEGSESLERMDRALKAALKMPPRKHKDEPKRKRQPRAPQK